SNWQLGQPNDAPKVGLGFRLQDGRQSGYRLAVVGRVRVYGGDDDPHSVAEDLLALQKIPTGGGASALCPEYLIGSASGVGLDNRGVTTNHWYGLTVTASGGQLTGALRVSPERTIVLGPVTDVAFDKGTISIFVQGSAE